MLTTAIPDNVLQSAAKRYVVRSTITFASNSWAIFLSTCGRLSWLSVLLDLCGIASYIVLYILSHELTVGNSLHAVSFAVSLFIMPSIMFCSAQHRYNVQHQIDDDEEEEDEDDHVHKRTLR